MKLKMGAAALAWLVLVPLMTVVGPPRPAEAARCDANRDRVVDGATADWTTNGADRVAEELEEKARRIYPRSRAGYRWQIPVCVEYDGTEKYVRVLGAAVEVVAAASRAWEWSALSDVLDDLGSQYWKPAPLIAPALGDDQIVGLEAWLAIDPGTWVEVSASALVGEVRVDATARPVATIWSFSDGDTRCEGPGTEYTPGASGPAPCGREWEHTTRVAPMSMEVRIEYEVSWTSSVGGSGLLTDLGGSLRIYDLAIGEIQSVGSLGERDHLTNPGLAPDRESELPACSLLMLLDGPCAPETEPPDWPESERDDGCDLWDLAPIDGDFGGCIDDIFDAITDATKWLAGEALELYNRLPGPHRALIEGMLDLLEGCASFGIDAVKGLWSAVEQVISALRDPVAYLQEQWTVINDLRLAISEDPSGFAAEFLGDLAELDLLESDPAKWVGKVGCEIAVAIFTGGSVGGSGRVARLVSKLDDIKLWRSNRRDRDRDRDPDGGDPGSPFPCATNSFPAGTDVLMADGTHRPIQVIRPGDHVMAFDVRSRRWSPRPVLDQWGHTDPGSMATATLVGGGRITATDDHRFWVDDEQRWVEIDSLATGDRLLTPDGVRRVQSVTTDEVGPTVVWELTVAVDHSYAVSTGVTDVVVHNMRLCDVTNRDEFGMHLTESVRTKADDLLQLNRDHRRLTDLEQRRRDGVLLTPAEADELRRLRARRDELVSNRALQERAALSEGGSFEHGVVGEEFTNIRIDMRSIDGGVYDGPTDTLRIIDPDAYLRQVERAYLDSGQALNPKTAELIRRYVTDPANGTLDAFDGPPGLHAEIRAFNDVVNQLDALGVDYELSDIQLSTVKLADRSGDDFPACGNCTGILPPEVGVGTGRTGG